MFNQKGFRATSLSDITKATGITKGAIYGNFENKDEVAVAAFDYAVEEIMSIMRQRIRIAKTAPEKLKAIILFYQEHILNPRFEGGCPIINTSVEADDNYPQLRIKAIRSIAILKDSIVKISHRGIRERQLKENFKVEEFSVLMFAAISGAVLLSRIEGDLDAFHKVKDQLFHQIDQYSFN